ncbi:MAG: hypothetical protein WD625_09545, partial [Balneolales bacterium]
MKNTGIRRGNSDLLQQEVAHRQKLREASTLHEFAPGSPALPTHPVVTNSRGLLGGCLLLVP